MTTTPAPRDERDIYEEWMLSENLDSSPVSWDGLITWAAWEKRAAIAESELAEVRSLAKRWEQDCLELRAELERVKQFLVDDGRPAFEAMCAEQSRNITRCDIEGLEWGYMNTLTHDRWCGFYAACTRLAAIDAARGVEG